MRRYLLQLTIAVSAALGFATGTKAQDFSVLDPYFPVRSFYVSLPPASHADEFISFVKDDMIPGGFNNLIVRVNWTFPFKSHPELIDGGAWDMSKIKELVNVCRDGGMTLVPMINMLGHQSWADKKLKLLQVYPEFDERPEVALPEPGTWKWPNKDNYYCKSYCPRHPDVHKILFECIDEMLEAFEAKDFHCGMDEVFDLASDGCPRCKGEDPAEILAEEINRINAHLQTRGTRMWMWADRLLDGTDAATGYGEWSASCNGTAKAIDMIDRNIVICDWHYRVAEQSAVLFALKGFDVLTCGWMHPPITTRQLEDLERFRTHSSSPTDKRYLGFMQTVWSGFPQFMKDYKENSSEDSAAKNYRHLKGLYLQYIEELRDKPFPQKDGRRIRGL